MTKAYLFLIALSTCIIFITGCKKDECVITIKSNGGKDTVVTKI